MLRATITFVLAFATLAMPGRYCCAGDTGTNCWPHSESDCRDCLGVHNHSVDNHSWECPRCEDGRHSSCPDHGPCICRHEHPTAIVSNQQADDSEVAGGRLVSAERRMVLLPPLNCVADRPSQILLQHARSSRFANSGELLAALNILRC